MNLLENPFGIPDSKYPFLMSMLNERGGLAFTPQTCKELMSKHIAQDVVLDYKVGVNHCRAVDGRINQKHPALVIWLKSGTTIDEKHACMGRIHDVGHMLAERMGTTLPVVNSLDRTTGAIVVFFDPWYLRSSVAMHGLMTFIRGAANREHPTSSIYNFIDSITVPHKGPYGSQTCQDGVQMKEAIKNDNLYGFLNKSLACLTRPGYDDWLLKRNSSPYDNEYRYLRWDGIVGWDTKYEHQDLIKYSMAELETRYGSYWNEQYFGAGNASPLSIEDGYCLWGNPFLVAKKHEHAAV